MFPFSPTFLCWGKSVFFSFCPFAVPFLPTVLVSPPPPCNPTQSLTFSSLALPSVNISPHFSVGINIPANYFLSLFPNEVLTLWGLHLLHPRATAIRSSHHTQEGLRWMKEHGPHRNLQVPALDPRLGFILLFSRKQHILMIESLGVEARRDVGDTGLSLKGCCELSVTNCGRSSTVLGPRRSLRPCSNCCSCLAIIISVKAHWRWQQE